MSNSYSALHEQVKRDLDAMLAESMRAEGKSKP